MEPPLFTGSAFNEDDWWTSANYRIIINTMALVRQKLGHSHTLDSALVEIEMRWRAGVAKHLKVSELLIPVRQRQSFKTLRTGLTPPPASALPRAANSDAASSTRLEVKRAALKAEVGSNTSVDAFLVAPSYSLPKEMTWRSASVADNPLVDAFLRNCRASLAVNRDGSKWMRVEDTPQFATRVESFVGLQATASTESQARFRKAKAHRPEIAAPEASHSSDSHFPLAADAFDDEPSVLALTLPSASDDTTAVMAPLLGMPTPPEGTNVTRVFALCRTPLLRFEGPHKAAPQLAGVGCGPGLLRNADGVELPFKALRFSPSSHSPSV